MGAVEGHREERLHLQGSTGGFCSSLQAFSLYGFSDWSTTLIFDMPYPPVRPIGTKTLDINGC